MKELRLEDLNKQELILFIRNRVSFIRETDLIHARLRYLLNEEDRLNKEKKFDQAIKKWEQAERLWDLLLGKRGTDGAKKHLHETS